MFSIIIPLYNKEKFIKRALDSILNQSFQEFEIIVVNDGSKDNSEEKVKEVSDPRIKIINQVNAGVSAARNRGAEEAQYKYLAFLDADDIWDKYFLSEIKNMIEQYPNAGIYAANNYFIYPDGKKLKNEVGDLFAGKAEGLLEDYFELFAELQRSPFSNSNFCVPREIYNDMGGYKVGVKLTEDSDLWCRIAFRYPIAYTTKPLATYYLAQEGSTNTIFQNQPFQVTLTLENYLKTKSTDKKLNSIKKLISLQLGLIKRGILTGNKIEIVKNLQDFSVFKYYPVEYIKCLITILIPNILLKKLI